jgi:hypothetical protein
MRGGGFRCKTGFSDLADFAINRWTVQLTATSCLKEYIISNNCPFNSKTFQLKSKSLEYIQYTVSILQLFLSSFYSADRQRYAIL